MAINSAASQMVTNPNFTSASLYVGDLSPDVTEALLFEIFNAVGPVASIRVCRDAVTRRSLGYAYVNFHSMLDAERALDTMNFTNIRGKPCRIMWSQRDPSLRKSGLGNIFVKNLDKSIDHKTLYDTFSMFGNILSCKVAMNEKGESLGYGFVHYEGQEAATKAIEKVNGMVIASEKVYVAPFKPKAERGGPDQASFTNVYMKNLPEEWDEEKFKAHFSEFGAITSGKLVKDENGVSKRFGFINFETTAEASRCVAEMNGKDLGNGEPLYVARAQKKSERMKELKDRFEKMKIERQKKYAGVNLYIKNLDDSVDDEGLKHEFRKFGAITSAKVMKDNSGRSKGFGFVCFTKPEEATKAVTDMNGQIIANKPLYVALAQRREVRRAALEAQMHASRNKAMTPAMVPPQMYPNGSPLFYPQPQQATRPGQFVAYPQVLPVQRRWTPQGNAPMMNMQPGRPGTMPVYNVAPMQRNAPVPQNQRGGRGGRGHNKGGRQQQQNRMKFNENARNQPRQPREPTMMPPAGPTPGGTVDIGGAAAAGGGGGAGGVPATGPTPGGPAPGGVIPQQNEPLDSQQLANAPTAQQKQMIGERIFPLIHEKEPGLAGKITGMLLEMDNGELLHLLESPDALDSKIAEALQVLERHDGAGGVAAPTRVEA